MLTALPDLHQFPCTSCGSKLEFSPQAKQLKCPYCGHEEEIPQEEKEVAERSFKDFVASQPLQTEVLSETAVEVACPGCRARITFEPSDMAGKCPFCGTSIVAKPDKAKPVAKPDGVVPCKVTQKEAIASIRKWLGKNWFVPNSLQKMAQTEGVQGVYLPFWTYDAQTQNDYSGARGEHYYETEVVSSRNENGEQETETREVCRTHWYPVSGSFECFFDDVLIPATKQIPEKRLKKLMDWDLNDVLAYSPSYLAGFKAQRYQVPLEAGWGLAVSKMEALLQNETRGEIGGDVQQIDTVQTAYSDVTFKHILLPVWLSAYRFNNKQYQVMVNAQTGNVLGDRPYSKAKIAAAVLGGIGLIFGGLMALAYFSQPQTPTGTRSEQTYRRSGGLRIPSVRNVRPFTPSYRPSSSKGNHTSVYRNRTRSTFKKH
jgi:predicted RNA-binding Zn-ribbon protein involved in translation (DUF1610 family)